MHNCCGVKRRCEVSFGVFMGCWGAKRRKLNSSHLTNCDGNRRCTLHRGLQKETERNSEWSDLVRGRRGMAEAGSKPGSLESLGVDLIKQYAAPEQVDLKVVVDMPGSWFGGMTSGSLSASEKRDSYEAQGRRVQRDPRVQCCWLEEDEGACDKVHFHLRCDGRCRS